jgi:hypothetical protein
VLALPAQVVQQSAVGRMTGRPGDELVDLRPQALGSVGQRGRVQGAGVVGVPQPKCVLQEAADRMRSLGLPGDPSLISSRQRRSRCARQVWWRAWTKRW